MAKLNAEQTFRANAVITALIVIVFAIIGSGFWVWINSGGRGP